MVTARQHRSYGSHTTIPAPVQLLKRSTPQTPVASPRVRVALRSRRREYQAWMTLLVLGSGLLLALGVLSLYGRICQTREINRRSYLNSQLKLERQRGEELTVKKARLETDANIAAEAARLHLIRPSDKAALTIP